MCVPTGIHVVYKFFSYNAVPYLYCVAFVGVTCCIANTYSSTQQHLGRSAPARKR